MTRRDLLKGIERWRFVPAGVADPAGKRVFVVDAQSGIAAAAVADGEQSWSSGAAAVPLIALNGALLAATRSAPATFVLLDATSGQAVSAIVAPPELSPSGEWWPTAVWREEKAIVVAWQNRAAAEGALAVDPQNGTVAPWSGGLQSAERPKGRRSAGTDLTFFRSADGSAEPWRAGDRMAALVVDTHRGKERLRLMTWDAADGGEVESTELARPLPRTGYLAHHRSPDTEHLFLLSCNDQDEEGAPAGTRCAWLVFRVSDGKKIAELPNPDGLLPPLAVVGNRLFYVESGEKLVKRGTTARRLCAVDTKSARLVWSRDLVWAQEKR